jgi:ADP-ribose pyrophosphatase
MKKMHDERLDEKQLSSEDVFTGRLLHVFKDKVKLPNGHESTREYIKHQGAVAILPVLPDGKLIFVRQYRYPVDSVIYEIPAGKLEKGEDPLTCAKRELSEETGYEAGTFTYLTSVLTTPGFTNETIHLYLATDLKRGAQHPDENEFLDVISISEPNVREMIRNGEIYDAKTLSTLLLYLLKK